LACCIGHLAVALAVASASCTRTPPSVAPRLDPLAQLRQDIIQATGRPGVQRGAWGIAVHSLDRNERLFELNPRTMLVPASVAKVVSVATAAEAVGWDYQFVTTLRATGPIRDGVLEGDLLIVGSGDPTIGGRAGPAASEPGAAGDDLAAWIGAIEAAGIRRISGRIIGDDDSIEDPRPQLAWAWDDLGYPGGALFGALNFAENRLAVTITAGPQPGAAATLDVGPHALSRALSNRVLTVASGAAAFVWPEQRPGDPLLTIAGTVTAGAPPVTLNVSAGNPTFWFASVLRARLQQHGIVADGAAWDVDDVVPAPDRAAAVVLHTHRSRPLSEVAQPLLKNSINLYAEAVMRLNAAPGAVATNDRALEGFNSRLAAWGVPAGAQQLIDGSGLSRRNAIAADAVVAILQRVHDPTMSSALMTGLPVAGVDGTLRTRMTGTAAAGNVRAKTGSMSNIRTLAGYVTTRDGERLAFAAMVNNFEGGAAAADQALDAIAVHLAGFSRVR
jgi:D-alanyl-D-alanine carboxypeptidase/D-alanyl-D-alanine-endopeptidase (penicillin-binding protein 4)